MSEVTLDLTDAIYPDRLTGTFRLGWEGDDRIGQLYLYPGQVLMGTYEALVGRLYMVGLIRDGQLRLQPQHFAGLELARAFVEGELKLQRRPKQVEPKEVP